MEIPSIGFIGGGRVTRLFLYALKQKNALPGKVLVSDPDETMRQKIQTLDADVIECFNRNLEVLDVDVLFLAVHPPVAKEIAAEVKGKIGAKTVVVSLIPVITTQKLITLLGGVTKLVRILPNAPSIIHQGYNPAFYSKAIGTEEKQQLQQIFQYWGEAPEVNEASLEAYAIVTAMGPTYFWFQWLKMLELGSQLGLSHAELKKAVPAMIHGATETLFDSDLSPEEVMDLIPVCPLKEDEPEIKAIFEKRLHGLYAKLTQNDDYRDRVWTDRTIVP
ncbi:NAD(P)-binding domain-containing protein [candidate division KSB1 bacterium]|nr:NAD(P)-binding domain-containing protein [candidate division KSB1 bacterium]